MCQSFSANNECDERVLIHLMVMVFGVKQSNHLPALHKDQRFLWLYCLVLIIMCSFQFNLLSKDTPRNLVLVFHDDVLPVLIEKVQFFFHVNNEHGGICFKWTYFKPFFLQFTAYTPHYR